MPMDVDANNVCGVEELAAKTIAATPMSAHSKINVVITMVNDVKSVWLTAGNDLTTKITLPKYETYVFGFFVTMSWLM